MCCCMAIAWAVFIRQLIREVEDWAQRESGRKHCTHHGCFEQTSTYCLEAGGWINWQSKNYCSTRRRKETLRSLCLSHANRGTMTTTCFSRERSHWNIPKNTPIFFKYLLQMMNPGFLFENKTTKCTIENRWWLKKPWFKKSNIKSTFKFFVFFIPVGLCTNRFWAQEILPMPNYLEKRCSYRIFNRLCKLVVHVWLIF